MANKKEINNIEENTNNVEGTFNPLLNALRINDKKNLFKTNITTAFAKTGFPQIDYYFGSVINIHDKDGNVIKQEPRVGQALGTFSMVISGSGGGKSTLMAQIAANIIRQFPYANVIYFDCENRFDVSRAETITKLPASYFDNSNGPERFMIKSGAISLETMQKMVVDIYKNKMNHYDELLIDTGKLNEFGRPIKILQPTIIIIDSLTTVINETLSPDSTKDMNGLEKMRSNTEGARDAKTLKGFLKDVIPLCKEANITIFGINHINNNMSMNAFLPVAKQQNFLKQDEVIPGGRSLIYYSFNIMKLTAKPSDDFKEDTDGFNGHIVQVEPIKSSSNQSGNNSKGISFDLVFSFKNGFDALRSIIWYGRQYGLVEGNKNKMKFKDDPSFTFSFKDIYKEKDKYPIWENIKKYIIPHLNTHLSFTEPEDMKFDEASLDY